MMVLIFLYNLVALPIIFLLSIIFSIFNTKIRKGLIGRFNSFSALKSFPTNKFSQIYWFHCASFGEYQQVETLIEQIKKRDQGIGIITSFFSPSGFENVNDRNIDMKIYLPFDFIFSSFKALRTIKPSKIFFTSSDFWPSFLFAANQLNITTVLTSARYRKSYNIFLKMFNKIFCVSDNDYHQIKKNISNDEIYKIGNPRYDRILNNLENVEYKLDSSRKDEVNILIFASMWDEDNKMIFEKFINSPLVNHFEKVIIVPHEVTNSYLNYYCSVLKDNDFSFKKINQYQNFNKFEEKYIIINKVGFLSKLYAQSTVAYVGGGFSKSGIHNIIEPAAASNPVIFGANFMNSNESDAEGLIDVLGGFSVDSYEIFTEKINWLLDKNNYNNSSKNCKSFVAENSGATKEILQKLYE
ncbi:MAG: hypothetical protein O3A49_03905 [Candidatus Marinimicrobia bacterium]|nr:hypothetical protein [Candidatus Neomarinimicrobiota bacterium]MDA1363947.1 hypothetical protein [Candidatus Neomarinimicrobiota bacterium]